MAHFYESILIDTEDRFQYKSYSNEHPEGYIIVKISYCSKEIFTSKVLPKRI